MQTHQYIHSKQYLMLMRVKSKDDGSNCHAGFVLYQKIDILAASHPNPSVSKPHCCAPTRMKQLSVGLIFCVR